MKMEERTEIKTESETSPSVRRSIRAKMPNSDLIKRRKILSQLPILKNTTRKITTTKKLKIVERNEKVNKVDLHIKKELDDTNDREELNKAFVKDAETPIKKENVDEESVNKTYPLKMPGNLFIAQRDAGLLCTMDKPIEPVYFPTEAENSGVILFNSSSKKAILKISFPKCFVILNGQFIVDRQGIFNVGDFIKAPAGSQLGIKYLGGSDSCGRIIFFRSHI